MPTQTMATGGFWVGGGVVEDAMFGGGGGGVLSGMVAFQFRLVLFCSSSQAFAVFCLRVVDVIWTFLRQLSKR